MLETFHALKEKVDVVLLWIKRTVKNIFQIEAKCGLFVDQKNREGKILNFQMLIRLNI